MGTANGASWNIYLFSKWYVAYVAMRKEFKRHLLYSDDPDVCLHFVQEIEAAIKRAVHIASPPNKHLNYSEHQENT